MAYGNPTDAQINQVNAADAAQTSDVLTNRGQDGYIWASGILEPEHSNWLSYAYPQYYATAILERIGSYEGVAQDEYSWSEMDRTRNSAQSSACLAGLWCAVWRLCLIVHAL